MSDPGLQLHTHVMARLDRWVVFCLWRADLLTPDPGPRSVKSWWFSMITARNMRVPAVAASSRAQCPVDELEAGATDVCVQQLNEKQRLAVLESFLTTGTAEEKAQRLGCSRRMFFYRLNAAYTSLLGLMQDYELGLARVNVDSLNAELESSRARSNAVSSEIKSGARVRGLTRGIA